MANYATLKAAIQQVIKTNGNNEITGALLQQSLLSMINSLGAGYQFVGVADTTTVPGTPDQNVAYIGGPGTYSNFDNSVVPDGHLGVFKYNGSWTTETVQVGKNYDPEISEINTKINGITSTNIQAVETSGKFISAINGTLANSSGFAYTGQFYVEKGAKIVVRAAGYQTSVAIIAKVISAGSSYTPLVASVDSTVRDYEYIVQESGYYAASYSTTQPRTISILRNTPDILAERITQLETTVSSQGETINALDNKTFGAQYNQQQVTENAGKFIGYQGTLATGSSFAYTNQFYVEKGTKITVRAMGYLTYVAIIAKVITDGVSYTPLVMSVDSTVREYSYIADESGYYAASYSTGQPRTIHLSINTPDALSSRITILETKVAAMEPVVESVADKLLGITENTSTPTIKESGKYINQNGSVMSSNGFAYSENVFVKGGTVLIVNARGYSTNVAIISKYIASGVYTPLVVSIDSAVHDYSYTVEEDGYFAFSWSTAQPISVKTITYPSREPETRLQENLYFGVPSVGIIGDSLASGATYNPSVGGVRDNIGFAWWKVFERKSGMTYRRFCVGGMSTRNFITNATYGLPVALTAGNECKLYIIGLAVNDRAIGQSYLGSVADIDLSNPDNNADTYFGNYARIIQKITAFNPGCKFILFTDPRTDGDFNDAIRTIAGMFSNCYLVDLWALYSKYYVSGGYFHAMQDQSAHYPSIAYQAMAKLLEAAVDDCINNNLSDFLNIQY